MKPSTPKRVTAKISCWWTQDSDGHWWTDCDNAFTFIDGGPADNDMKFCCYCGGTLLQCPADASKRLRK